MNLSEAATHELMAELEARKSAERGLNLTSGELTQQLIGRLAVARATAGTYPTHSIVEREIDSIINTLRRGHEDFAAMCW